MLKFGFFFFIYLFLFIGERKGLTTLLGRQNIYDALLLYFSLLFSGMDYLEPVLVSTISLCLPLWSNRFLVLESQSDSKWETRVFGSWARFSALNFDTWGKLWPNFYTYWALDNIWASFTSKPEICICFFHKLRIFFFFPFYRNDGMIQVFTTRLIF